MTSISALTGSSLGIRTGNSLSIGVRPGATPSGASTKALTAQQGADASAKAVKNSSAIFDKLSALKDKIAQATPKDGSEPDAKTVKALNAEIASVKKEIDKLAAASDLTSGKTSTVSIKTTSGVTVTVASQGLDSKSLGLDNLKITDAASLRAATGKVAQAVGKTQVAAYQIQTADAAVGAGPTESSPAATAYDKVLGNQKAGSAASKASASVEAALNAQKSANAGGYTASGGASSSSPSILSLLA